MGLKIPAGGRPTGWLLAGVVEEFDLNLQRQDFKSKP